MSTRRGGPYPRLRLDLMTKAQQGQAVYLLVLDEGLSFRQAAARLDMSLTTCWRRFWWYSDWTLPGFYGRPAGPLPPLRGTRACPRGQPYLPTIHGPGGPLHRSPGGTPR